MINVFKKLKSENLLNASGSILDLGSGSGNITEPFLDVGYTVTLVDNDEKILSDAKAGNIIIHCNIEDFSFNEMYDGIFIVNVLPFLNDKIKTKNIINHAYNVLRYNGFLFFSVFGPMDQWAIDRSNDMSFFTKEEALALLTAEPYFTSEDYGKGATMDGKIKMWHILYFLYIKNRSVKL